ncbi:Uma2 family endonuclease [Nocardioides speluncae]|uniref:Uma2 family endonuclease n=1 Tax=Nocardioides speluncae TaxID=2670337 RepID=UPI00197E918C|nr:Uma2 family endonuclease [Nocardioides speluncae]
MSTQASIELPRRRFTVAEYEAMARTGVLREDDRVELLDGEIVVMTPIGPPHAGVVKRLNRLLVTALGEAAIVGVQDPLRLSAHSEPEPDLVVARPRSDDYTAGHPGPDDALLVIEVADSSLAVDRGVKVPLYAAAGITEVWLVDLAGAAVHVHRAPAGSAYTEIQTLRRGDTVTPLAFPDLAVELTAILGD